MQNFNRKKLLGSHVASLLMFPFWCRLFKIFKFHVSPWAARSDAWTPQAPVDFEVFAHYSGHSSYTKGLLLVDRSGASSAKASHQIMELTAEDCRRWRAGRMPWCMACCWWISDATKLVYSCNCATALCSVTVGKTRVAYHRVAEERGFDLKLCFVFRCCFNPIVFDSQDWLLLLSFLMCSNFRSATFSHLLCVWIRHHDHKTQTRRKIKMGHFWTCIFFAAFTLHESCDVVRFWK